MKRYRKVLIVCALLIAGLTATFLSLRCDVKGDRVCYDNQTGSFKREKNASLKVQVPTQIIADQLTAVWTETYPEIPLEVWAEDALSLEALQSDFSSDVVYVNQEEAVYFMSKFKDMDRKAHEVIGTRIPIGIQDAINKQGFFIAQNTLKGPGFYVNKTKLDAMDLTLEDISSFEGIQSKEDIILGHLEYSYPLSFKDQYTFYHNLTAGKWALNFKNDGDNPDFDSVEFLESLQFIEFLSSMTLSHTPDTKAEDLAYIYESAFFEGKSLFAFTSDLDLLNQYSNKTGDEYLMIPFPSYKGHHLGQVLDVKGYAVSSTSLFPSASTEVIRILRSPEFVNLFSDPEEVAIYSLNFIDELGEGYDSRIDAMMHGDAMTLLALKENPSIRSSDLYSEVDLMPILMELYDGTLDASGAQEAIVKLAIEWYESKVEVTE